MIPGTFIAVTPSSGKLKELYHSHPKDGSLHEKVIGINSKIKTMDPDTDDYSSIVNAGHFFVAPQEKCAVLVISNQGHPMHQQQSLMRKYRYNKYGDLIPSSVQYFIKFPRASGSPVLVPLKDKAFSPTGGFVRYYKEIPPIPQKWKR